MWCSHTMEYYSGPKKNKALTLVTLKMYLENRMLRGRGQTQKATCCMIPLICSVQNRQFIGPESRSVVARGCGRQE